MTILSAYKDFEERVDIVSDKSSAMDMVRLAIQKKIGKFTKAEIMELCPTLSESAINKSLKILKENGEIQTHGTGKSTFYNRIM